MIYSANIQPVLYETRGQLNGDLLLPNIDYEHPAVFLHYRALLPPLSSFDAYFMLRRIYDGAHNGNVVFRDKLGKSTPRHLVEEEDRRAEEKEIERTWKSMLPA